MKHGSKAILPGGKKLLKVTGVIRCDENGIVLKPHWFHEQIKDRFLILLIIISLAILFSTAIWWLANPMIAWWQVMPVAIVFIISQAAMVLSETTLLAIKGTEAIIIESRLLHTRMRFKKRFLQISEIKGIEIIKKRNPKAYEPMDELFTDVAPFFYYIYLMTPKKKKLFWYTRYEEASFLIANTLSAMLTVPVRDPGDILKEKTKDSAG